jgi:sortase B
MSEDKYSMNDKRDGNNDVEQRKDSFSQETVPETNIEEIVEFSSTKINDISVSTSIVSDSIQPELKKKVNIYKVLRILFSVGFIVFAALFLNEVIITPYRINKSIERTKELYNNLDLSRTESIPTGAATATLGPKVSDDLVTNTPEVNPASTNTDPNRDEKGRLLQFLELLKVNEDVKGWITIPDSNIDYVVLQSDDEDPEYYLTRDIEKKELKAGSLFLDYKSSVEDNTQNLVIHGHNMTSSDNMFHYLLNYKELDYYKERPVFTFDTIYQTGQWKIFAIIVTNGTSIKEPLFNYTRAAFKDSSDFLNFVYQLRIRSIYHIDTVDVNENDQLLALSTCSYEVKNYRTVIIARKVREGEDTTVDVDSVTVNPEPLYPGSWYYRYGGKAPELTETFEEALNNGEIHWYLPEIIK